MSYFSSVVLASSGCTGGTAPSYPYDPDSIYEEQSCDLETPDTFLKIDEAQFAPGSVEYYTTVNTDTQFVYTGPLVFGLEDAAPAAREGMIRHLIDWWMSNTEGGRECRSSQGDAIDGDNEVELVGTEIRPWITGHVYHCFSFNYDTAEYSMRFFYKVQADVSNAEVRCGETIYPFFDSVE